MKKEWVNPEIKFITDPDIILGCLYEVYGQEQKSVLAGKNIRHTMIFPFLRMLANNTQGDVRNLEALHQRLWKIYEKEPESRCLYSRERKSWRLSGKEKMVDDFL